MELVTTIVSKFSVFVPFAKESDSEGKFEERLMRTLYRETGVPIRGAMFKTSPRPLEA